MLRIKPPTAKQLFYKGKGQYRSTLVCPVCNNLSITFDPFMCLSLPLPSKTIRTMTVTVFSSDGTSLPFPVTVTVPKFGRFKDLVQALITACSLGENESLLVAEVFNNCIIQFLDNPSDSLELIRDIDQIVAYRMPEDCDTSRLVVFMHEKESDATPSLVRFGVPLVARMADFCQGSNIRDQFLKLLNPFFMPVEDDYDYAYSAKGDTVMEGVTTILDGDENNGLDAVSDVGDDFQFYLMQEKGLLSRKTMITMNEPVPVSGISMTIDVLVSWTDKMVDLYDTSLLSSLRNICEPALFAPQDSVTLYKCLEAFLKEEPLGPEDMWYCPICKEHRQASKKLDLWRLPEILIIHLKRFSYNWYFKNKLDTFVEFPVQDFDLSNYIVQNNSLLSLHYKLYAISNHYGGIGGGHYTAFVQHGHNRWYEFDDSHVSPVPEESQIKSSAAYVLFYKRIKDV